VANQTKCFSSIHLSLSEIIGIQTKYQSCLNACSHSYGSKLGIYAQRVETRNFHTSNQSREISIRATNQTLEALGCDEACVLAKDIHATSVRVALDCKNMVQTLDQGTMGVYSHITTEIVESHRNFRFLKFKFESMRSNNDEAHNS
jgi:ribonuclease HI